MWILNYWRIKMRTGLLAQKIGMSRIFYEDGTAEPVTILKCSRSQVVDSFEKDGHNFVKMASFIDHKNVGKLKKPQLKAYKSAKIKHSAKIYDFKVSKDAKLSIDQEVTVQHFAEGQYVDVQGVSVGKGFAGAMKRHGFAGLEATHGVSVSHRSHGSTGQCQDPGRVFKGKKMAGHLGDDVVTIQNLRVLLVDSENEIIAISGAVPGKKGGFVKVKDALKKALTSNVPFPTYVTESKVAEVSDQVSDTNSVGDESADKGEN
jgi:large subunit ribosomal protein L3